MGGLDLEHTNVSDNNGGCDDLLPPTHHCPPKGTMMLPRITARCASLLCLTALAASAGGQTADCVTPDFMSRADVRGLGVADINGTNLNVSVYGYAEYPFDCVTEDTIFEAASLTKPVVAYLVMRLVEQGRLGLDDALLERLPELQLPADDPRTPQVTVRMALAHSTGLQGPDTGTLRFVRDPGETFDYYPAGYRMVQRIVESIEGASLEEIAQREVFRPLGMTSSSLVFRADLLENVATRHRMLGGPFQRDRNPDAPANAAASLITTPGDYGRFLRAILNAEGLRPESVRTMLTPQVSVPDTNDRVAWGIGWGLEPEGGTFFHWGDAGATKSFTMGSLSERRAFVYLTNSYYGMAIAGEMSTQRFPGAHPSVEWLDYGAWDDPRRCARRDVVRAFVEGTADQGMETFFAYERDYPTLDMDNLANFVVWIIGGRQKHEGRARLLAWQIERQPDNIDLYLNRVRSLRAVGDDTAAVEDLREVLKRTDDSTAATIRNQITWIEDEMRAEQMQGQSPPFTASNLVGTYGERRIFMEGDLLRYRRGEGQTYTLRWMHGRTYAFEEFDTFRLRFIIDDDRIVSVMGLYEDGRTDESPRDDR